MKTLLTRIGEHSKFIISGDLDQSDKYRDYTKSGLYDAMTRQKTLQILDLLCLAMLILLETQ
jgi:phosphate starvation-inducible protein PhoH